jgi:hypothetical protein
MSFSLWIFRAAFMAVVENRGRIYATELQRKATDERDFSQATLQRNST